MVVSPPSGATVPPKFSVWVFVNDDMVDLIVGQGRKDRLRRPAFSPRVHPERVRLTDARGKELPTKLTLVSPGVISAYRIDADAPPEQQVALAIVAGGAEQVVNFTTRAASKEPHAEPFSVLSAVDSSFRWTCSSERAVVLTFSREAAAYRIVWAKSEKDWTDGRRDSILLPATPSAFWTDAPGPRRRELALGTSNCFGTVLPQLRDGPLVVGISALDADGTESPLTEPRVVRLPPQSEAWPKDF